MQYIVHAQYYTDDWVDSAYVRDIPPPQIDLMDHPLYTISYVADVENMLVIMINRILPPSPSPEATTGDQPLGGGEREKGVEQEEGSGEGAGEESEKVKGEGVEEGEGQGAGDPVQEGQEGEEGEGYNGINVGPIPRMTCHVLETNDVSTCTYTCT